MAELVTRAELARIAGVRPPSITKAVAKQFPGAVVGDRIDLEHPDVIRYLGKRDGATTRAVERAAAPAAPTAAPARPSTRPHDLRASELPQRPAHRPLTALGTVNPYPRPTTSQLPSQLDNAHRDTKADDIMRYAHMSLTELLAMFGTATAFGDFLDARKRMSDIQEKDLKNEERMGRLITREFVETHLFSHIDTTYKRLLQDSPPNIAQAVYAAFASGMTVEEAEGIVRDNISAQLRGLKEGTAARVRGLGQAAA